MTVIVGVLCKDGVVIGSDSSATFRAGTLPTIEQPAQKVFLTRPDVLFAGCGSVGCVQRFHAYLERFRPILNLPKEKGLEIAKRITKAMIEDLEATSCPRNTFAALVAFPSSQGLQLCEFEPEYLQPELKTENLWFVSMGSGQPITDPFLGMMRRVFFSSSRPNLREGIFAVTWTLQQAIELNTGGINGPMQIGVLTQKPGSGEASARLLDEVELDEHRNNVKAIERHLADYRDKLSGQGAQAIPQLQGDPVIPPPA